MYEILCQSNDLSSNDFSGNDLSDHERSHFTRYSPIPHTHPILDQLAQAKNLLVFLKQHGQQKGLDGQRMGCVRRRSQVLVGRGKQIIQRQLIAAP